MNHHAPIHWEWPAVALETSSSNHTVAGLFVPYGTLCWYERENGKDLWESLNPAPEVRLPPPEYLFTMADVVIATAAEGTAPAGATGGPADAVILSGQRRYENLVGGRLKRPENLKVLVVPLDFETDEFQRLAAWVGYLRGQEHPAVLEAKDEVPAPYEWDQYHGAKE